MESFPACDCTGTDNKTDTGKYAKNNNQQTGLSEEGDAKKNRNLT